jgi:hypothetical protein
MTIEQKIFSKLEPHATRIIDGSGNEFDYLPAVLLQLLEGQKRQAKLIDYTAELLASIKSTADIIGKENKAQIAATGTASQRKIEQLETVINNGLIQFQNSYLSASKQITALENVQAAQSIQINKNLDAIGLQIESIASSTVKANVKLMRLLVFGLFASTATILLAVAILQRH